MASISGTNIRPRKGETMRVFQGENSVARAADLPQDIKEAGDAMQQLVNRADAVFVTTSFKKGEERVVSIRASVKKFEDKRQR